MSGWRKRQVLEMAREADLIDDTSASDWYVYQLERFAELVRADEREKWMERTAILIRGERKGCWNIIFEYAGRDDITLEDESLLKHLADLIRARGQA